MKKQTISRTVLKNYEPLSTDSKFVDKDGTTLGIFAKSNTDVIIGPDVIPSFEKTVPIKIDLESLLSEHSKKIEIPEFSASDWEELVRLYKGRDSGTPLINETGDAFRELWFRFKTYEIEKGHLLHPRKHIIHKPVIVCGNCKSPNVTEHEVSSFEKTRSFIDENGKTKSVRFTEESRPFKFRCRVCGTTNKTEVIQEEVDLTFLRQNPETKEVEYYRPRVRMEK